MRVLWAGIVWHAWRPYAVLPVGGGEPSSAPGDPAQSTTDGAQSPVPKPGMFDELASALASARAVFSNFLDLVAIEARRATHALVWIIALAVVAGVCIVAAWLALMLALAMVAIALGIPPVAAVVAVAALNIALAALLISVGLRKGRDLLFAASRRQIAGGLHAPPPAP